MSKNILNDDYSKFEQWLISNYGYSNKAARDCISRCHRIEKNLLNLNEAVSKEDRFNKLLININEYSLVNTKSKKSALSLKATLRASAKKYALYKSPKWLATTLYPIENNKILAFPKMVI